MGRLLVIEDDRRLGETLCAELRGAGWTVAWARPVVTTMLAQGHGITVIDEPG